MPNYEKILQTLARGLARPVKTFVDMDPARLPDQALEVRSEIQQVWETLDPEEAEQCRQSPGLDALINALRGAG